MLALSQIGLGSILLVVVIFFSLGFLPRELDLGAKESIFKRGFLKRTIRELEVESFEDAAVQEGQYTIKELYEGESFENAVEGLRPGDTLIVYSGTYEVTGRISITVTGTSVQPVVIEGRDLEGRGLEGRGRPRVIWRQSAPHSHPQNTINIEGASYLTMRNLEISSQGSLGDGIKFFGSHSHHVTLEDLVIHGVQVGINVQGNANFLAIRDNHIKHVDFVGAAIILGCFTRSCSVGDSIVERNLIEGDSSSRASIFLRDTSYSNIIRENVVVGVSYVAILLHGARLGGRSRNLVEGNFVADCSEGIQVHADAVVRNNVIVGCGIGFTSFEGFEVFVRPRNLAIVHNTILDCGRCLFIRDWDEHLDDLVFANNAVYCEKDSSPHQPRFSTEMQLAGNVFRPSLNQFPTSSFRPGRNIWQDFVGGYLWNYQENVIVHPASDSRVLGAGVSTYGVAYDYFGCPVRKCPPDAGAIQSDSQSGCVPFSKTSKQSILPDPTFGRSQQGPKVIHIYPGHSFSKTVADALPGDTIIVHEGDYDVYRASIIVNGTEDRPVIIQGATGEARPRIHWPHVGRAAQNVVNIEGSSFLVLRHLEIDGAGTGDGIKFFSENNHDVVLEDLVIHNVTVGINAQTDVDRLFLRNCHIYETSTQGIYMGCPDGSCVLSDSIIEKNWIHDTGTASGDGIEIKKNSYGVVVRDNIIHNTGFPCILLYGSGGNARNLVEGNIMWNCHEGGIQVAADALVQNNVVLNSSIGFNSIPHNGVSPGNLHIVHNTFLNNEKTLNIRDWNGKTDIVLANNALYSTSDSLDVVGGLQGVRIQGNVISPRTMVFPPSSYKVGRTPASDFQRGAYPTANSAVRSAASRTYATVTDTEGVMRDSFVDAGAYEWHQKGPRGNIEPGFKEFSAAPVVVLPWMVTTSTLEEPDDCNDVDR